MNRLKIKLKVIDNFIRPPFVSPYSGKIEGITSIMRYVYTWVFFLDLLFKNEKYIKNTLEEVEITTKRIRIFEKMGKTEKEAMDLVEYFNKQK